jgi:hypothetical protein
LDYQTFLLDSTHCYSIKRQAGYIGSIIALAIGHAEPIAEGQEVERDGYRLKVEGGRIFRTLTSDQQREFERGIRPSLWSPVGDSEWWSSNLCDPKRRWREVEEEALSLELGRHHPRQPIPTFVAVTFQGVIGGRHRSRPATDAEVEAKHAHENWPGRITVVEVG